MNRPEDWKIMLIEDEPSIVFTLQDTLESEGYGVEVVTDGTEAAARVEEVKPDLILLDLMLPGRSGFDICEELRGKGVSAPIIMLTARDRETDKVKGLMMGADDYVTKPFGVKELLARIQAQLRRASLGRRWMNEPFMLGDLELDLRGGTVTRPDGSTQTLSTREIQIIQYFLQKPNAPVTRDELLEKVWNYEQTTNTRTVDVHMSKLRNKIEMNSEEPRHLVTLHGVGYMLKMG